MRIALRRRTVAIPADIRREVDSEITRRALSLPAFRLADTIFCYFSVGAEIDTRPLLEQTLRLGKTLCLPRCQSGGTMDPVAVSDLRALTEVFFGIPQPGVDALAVPPESIDLAIVPGLAFDLSGYRLGQGGGYYDRFLPKLSGVAVGLCRSAVLLPKVPRDPHDQPISILVTEKEIAELKI
ncbi:MAG: 5-formyltetrahydrofolate cyclo-ligase [Oscillospiraceae bacterium]|nr:5-formyltetrahydrofolate cyclo-ligase [Oscillospiraceae bacterium]